MMKTSAVLLGGLSLVSLPVLSDTVLWPSESTVMKAQPDSRLTILDNGRAAVTTGTKYEWPGVRMDFREGERDLSSFGWLEVGVSNTTDRPVVVNLSVKSRAVQGRSPGGSVSLAPHAVGAIRTRLELMPWKLDGPLDLQGMNGYPSGGGSKMFDLRRTLSFHVFRGGRPEPAGYAVTHITAGGSARSVKVLSAERFLPFVDEFGQFKHDEWPGKIHSDDELKATVGQEAEWLAANGESPIPQADRFGGWAAGPQLKATGFFRVEKVKGKWWLVDPEGHLFYSHGVDCVRLGEGTTGVGFRESYFETIPPKDDPVFGACHGVCSWPAAHGFYKDPKHCPFATYNFCSANLVRKYGSDWRAKTSDLVHRRLKAWGVNTIGNWSQIDIARMDRTPYVATVHTSSFPKKLPRSKGWWGPLPDVYDPEYAEHVRKRVRDTAKVVRDDPWCVGVFVDNEMSWNEEPDTLAAAERYFSLVSAAMKAELPNHLYLGCRFMARSGAGMYRVAAKYCDVVSVNIYARTPSIDYPSDAVDRPFIIGEFHFGALDRGLFHTGLVATESQAERAQCYQDYHNACLDNPRCVGAHWFQWKDQALTGRADGENYQIGFLTVADVPYPELVEAARTIARTMYLRRY